MIRVIAYLQHPIIARAAFRGTVEQYPRSRIRLRKRALVVEELQAEKLVHRGTLSNRHGNHTPTLFVRDLDDPLVPVFTRNILQIMRSEGRLGPRSFIICQIHSIAV
jgi:hypothetical protein